MELTRNKRFNNERVQPSQIKFHLCFYCGEQFNSVPEYQRHIIQKHQAIALCYQIYQAEFRAERRQRKNESDQAQRSKEGLSTSPSTSSARKSISAEALSEPAKVSVKPNRLSGDYERGRDDKQRRERESFGFGREKEIERAERERKYKIERDRKQKEERRRKLEESGRISPSSLSKKKLLKKVKDFDLPPQDISCPICEPNLLFSDPSFTIQHIVRSHGASIVSMVVLLYENDILLATKPSKSGENCPRCDIDFDLPTEYFLHLIMAHRLDVGTSFKKNKYPTCTNFAIKTSLQYKKEDSLLVITSRDRLPDEI